MKFFFIPLWKKAPFIRLLLPLVCGIVLQRYCVLPVSSLAIFFAASIFFLAIIAFSKLLVRYRAKIIIGVLLNISLIFFGAGLYESSDTRSTKNWYGRFYHDSNYVQVALTEVPIEKQRSWKAEAVVRKCFKDSAPTQTTGKIIIYFEKDSSVKLNYGDVLLFNKPLEDIKGSGNPGAFDYRQFCAFKGLYQQVYLKRNEWIRQEEREINAFNKFLIDSRLAIISILKKYIKGKDEAGIAEALLIGYKEDLDKELVQAYSNTGVVHIIAISGLHLGLIYVMLLWIVNKIPVVKRSRISKLILILSALWIFSLLTGASASVLRSAVMFTCILAGDTLQRKASIYNSLAASAFILLCYDPYILWDVGFQLSYFAVVGIVCLQKPIYNLFYIKYKWIDKIWQLMAVSMAAQVFTTPVCIYYFHQFPNYFLLTNLVAVPLSSLILFLEIFLLVIAKVPLLPEYLGKLINFLIWLMNEYVLFIQNLPFASTENISQGLIDTIILYALVISCFYWWLRRTKSAMFFSLSFLFLLMTNSAFELFRNQDRVIVYNIQKHSAIDIINGGKYYFIGDTSFTNDAKLANFNLQPTRIFYNATMASDTFSGIGMKGFYFISGKKFFIADKNLKPEESNSKVDLDAVILAKNARLEIADLKKVFNAKTYVIDGSNSLWKIGKWKKECELLHLRCYIVPEQGAYILDL